MASTASASRGGCNRLDVRRTEGRRGVRSPRALSRTTPSIDSDLPRLCPAARPGQRCLRGHRVAIVKVRITRLQTLTEEGHPGAAAALKMSQELDGYLSATQFGITLASLGLDGSASRPSPTCCSRSSSPWCRSGPRWAWRTPWRWRWPSFDHHLPAHRGGGARAQVHRHPARGADAGRRLPHAGLLRPLLSGDLAAQRHGRAAAEVDGAGARRARRTRPTPRTS